MAKKRTKADKAQRQANQLEKRADTRPEQTPKGPNPARTSAKPLRGSWEKQLKTNESHSLVMNFSWGALAWLAW